MMHNVTNCFDPIFFLRFVVLSMWCIKKDRYEVHIDVLCIHIQFKSIIQHNIIMHDVL